MITLTFPFKLISKDNEKIFNRAGRPFLSRKYKDWEEQVRDYALVQMSDMKQTGYVLECDLEVQIKAYFKTRNHCDAYNLPKGVMDSLQGITFINDSQIKKGSIEVIEHSKDNSFQVTIIPILNNTK